MYYRCDTCGCYLDDDGLTCDECQLRDRVRRARRVQADILVDGPLYEYDEIGGLIV